MPEPSSSPAGVSRPSARCRREAAPTWRSRQVSRRRGARSTAEEPGDLDELFLVGTFLRRPPAELFVVPLEKRAILAAAARVSAPKAKVPAGHAPGSDPKSVPEEPSLF